MRKRKQNYLKRYGPTVFAVLLIAVFLIFLTKLLLSWINNNPDSGVDVNAGATSDNAAVSGDAGESDELVIDTDAWNLILINSSNPLPDDYEIQLASIGDDKYVNNNIYAPLTAMLEDGNAEGLQLLVCAAYRSVEYQEDLFSKQVAKWADTGLAEEDAVSAAMTVVAYPGYSEHNAGLSVDICAEYYQQLDDGFGETDEAIWLLEHCAEYGFILRYPSKKSDITGIIYEPWHFRYVGVEAATYIMENGLCLEEYLALAE